MTAVAFPTFLYRLAASVLSLGTAEGDSTMLVRSRGGGRLDNATLWLWV